MYLENVLTFDPMKKLKVIYGMEHSYLIHSKYPRILPGTLQIKSSGVWTERLAHVAFNEITRVLIGY